jgi:hypothetical protein
LILLFVIGVFSSNAANITSTATGNWSAGATWVGGVAPVAGDNVTIASGNTVTLTADAACNNLTLTSGTGTVLALGAFTLEISGTVTGYRGSTAVSASLITYSTGKFKFIGSSRIGFEFGAATGTNYWTTTPVLPNTEVALSDATQVLTVSVAANSGHIRLNSLTVTTGIFDASTAGELRIGGSTDGTGSCSVGTSGTIKCHSLRRTSTGTTYCGTVTIDGLIEINSTIMNGNTVTINGILRLKSSSSLGSNPSASFSASDFVYGASSVLEYANTTNQSMGNEINRNNGSVSTINKMKVNIATTGVLSNNFKNPKVKDLEFTSGKISLGSSGIFTIISGGSITGYDANKYIVATASAAALKIENVGASSVVFPIGVSTSSYTPITLINAGTVDIFSAYISTTVPSGLLDATKAATKTWNINESVAGGSNVTMSIQYNASGDMGASFDYSAITGEIGHHNGTIWDKKYAVSVTGTGPYLMTATGIDVFSPFIIGNASSVLPISLIDFTVKNNENTNFIAWETAIEQNVRNFIVEKSANGKDWATLYIALPNPTKRYEIMDNSPFATTYYRLKNTDNDGREQVSKIISISKKGENAVSVYPNPTEGILNVSANDYEQPFVLINSIGQVVLQGEQLGKTINLQALPSGFYYLKIGAQTMKVVKE